MTFCNKQSARLPAGTAGWSAWFRLVLLAGVLWELGSSSIMFDNDCSLCEASAFYYCWRASKSGRFGASKSGMRNDVQTLILLGFDKNVSSFARSEALLSLIILSL